MMNTTMIENVILVLKMVCYGGLTSEKKVSYALYVYIASRDLDETDQQK